MRTDALLTAVISSALLAACDQGSGDPQDDRLILDPIEQAEPDADHALPSGAGDIADRPDVIEDIPCVQYVFAQRENESKESNCAGDASVTDVPVFFPDWEEIFEDRLTALADGSCAIEGSSNDNALGGGIGGLPGGNFPQPVMDAIDDFSDRESEPTAAFNPFVKNKTVCDSVCASHNKKWVKDSANNGTCAFNLVYNVGQPQHQNNGPACQYPGTRRWYRQGTVDFSCGCRCQ
ncbi:MAG: hypothetical protein K0V04_02305 [Deltaproteobacteria bacterium]|nr:hypothetical protein [Deltaproteobacteria bacterium]